MLQAVLSELWKQLSPCHPWGRGSHQATPTHLSPVVTFDSHSEVKFPGVGAGEQGGLVPIVALPRCQVAASSANWQEKEKQK